MEYIRRIGLREADARKYPDELSGGMQQRVAIAQALITRPRILLMDEAFSALDPGTRRGMQQLIRDLWRDLGTTILFVTHNTHEALTLGSPRDRAGEGIGRRGIAHRSRYAGAGELRRRGNPDDGSIA